MSRAQQTDTILLKKIVITTSALEYIPDKLNVGNFNLGAEMFVANNKTINANVGLLKSYGPSDRNWFQLSSQRTTGFKLQLEGRHYLNRHKIFDPAVLLFWPHIFQYKSQSLKNSGYYFALHGAFQHTNTKREETIPGLSTGYPFPDYDSHSIQNDYTVKRAATRLHVKFGYQSIKSCGLVIDYSVGLGGQYISSSPEGKLGSDNDKDWPTNKFFDEGSGFYLSPVYQIRIGWGF
jgi:hypothetical protein